MADLLGIAERVIAEGGTSRWSERMNQELSEVGAGIALIESFSHVIVFRTDGGLLLFDTSTDGFGPACVASLRDWSTDPIHSIVYTHGHIDHVGGSGAFLADAERRGHPRPEVIGHVNVEPRFERYRTTDGYNAVINERQFGQVRMTGGDDGDDGFRFLPASVLPVSQSFEDELDVQIGELDIRFRHDRGETDDHAWAWVPQHRAICVGDFVTWVFPNAGNPQKVQRYPAEWAAALRSMAALEPELLLPAHGLPIAGRSLIAEVLDDLASALEGLTHDVLAMMNEGARLDEILHTVRVDPELLAKPYMRPVYDEPEFVVRNIWRLYGGWYDGNPARLKPAPDAALAAEVSGLVGGVDRLVARGLELSANGDHRLACHLVEMAVQADPADRSAHAARRDVYGARRSSETSLMAKGIYRWASSESGTIADAPPA